MAKLLKAVKEEIVRKACAETFKARRAEHKLAWNDFSCVIYNRLYTEREQALMASLPPEWLAWKTNETCYIESTPVPQEEGSRRYNRGYDYCNMKFTNAKPFTFKDYGSTQTVRDTELFEKFKALEDAERTIEKESRDLERTLLAMLKPIHSDTKLITVWPDAVKYMPATDEAGDMVPAIQGSEVNAMIAALTAKRP